MAPAHLAHSIIDLLGAEKRALHVAEIASKLGTRNDVRLRDTLEDLVYEGTVTVRAGRRYQIAPTARRQQNEQLEGHLHAHPKGFGFVKVAGADDDVFVPPEAIGGAMHTDRVIVRVVAQTRRGREGEIVEIVSRGVVRTVGVLRGRAAAGGRGRWLEPDDSRIRGPIELLEEEEGAPPEGLPARAGLAAVVELARYPIQSGENPQGRLIAVLGQPGDPDVEVSKVLIGHGIDEHFDPAAQAEARAYGDAVDPAEMSRREDLRHIPLVTIDPSDARDHDDALWVERDDQGNYDAWIAIADVSHYVRPGTALDASSLTRGCSVYLPDRAVPMLPPELSSVLCSLLPDVDRLCMCVHAKLDATGKLLSTRLLEGAMRSRAFISYDAAARALGFTTEPTRDPKAEEIRHDLRVMWDLSSQLRKRRMRRGALDLNVPEARVVVDADTRKPVAISQRSDDPGVRKAYRLVEEMMLLANEAVARFCLQRKLATIFRVHAPPDPEKLERFAAVCQVLGLSFDVDDASDPKLLSKFLQKIEAHPKCNVIHNMLLRALQQACYDTANIGHYGLASGAYLHFTSPIRRYPDLVVHRAIRASIRGEKVKSSEKADAALKEAALTASKLERNAMETEREVSDVYRTLFMQAHIGENFEGTVSAVTMGGLYVRLDDPFVDVLVPLDALGLDSYEPDDLALTVVGQRSGDSIGIGDRILVLIEDAAIQRRLVLGKRVLDSAPNARRLSKKDRTKQRRLAHARQGGPKKGARKGRGRGRGRR